MSAVTNGADSLPVGNMERAKKIRERLDALGISYREFHERTGIDRKAVRRAATGANVRGTTYTAIETWLPKLERETGDIQPDTETLPEGFEYVGDPSERFISFWIEDARMVVKGPIGDADVIREQAFKAAERARRLNAERLKETGSQEA